MSSPDHITYLLVVKAINQARDIDEQRLLRELVSNAYPSAASKLPDPAENIGLVSVEPPLRLEGVGLGVGIRVRGYAGVVDDEIRTFGEVISFERQILGKCVLRRPYEDLSPSQQFLGECVHVRQARFVVEGWESFRVVAADGVDLSSRSKKLVPIQSCGEHEDVERESRGVAPSFNELTCKEHLTLVVSGKLGFSKEDITGEGRRSASCFDCFSNGCPICAISIECELPKSFILLAPPLKHNWQSFEFRKAVDQIERRGVHEEHVLCFCDCRQVCTVVCRPFAKSNAMDERVGIVLMMTPPEVWVVPVPIEEP